MIICHSITLYINACTLEMLEIFILEIEVMSDSEKTGQKNLEKISKVGIHAHPKKMPTFSQVVECILHMGNSHKYELQLASSLDKLPQGEFSGWGLQGLLTREAQVPKYVDQYCLL